MPKTAEELQLEFGLSEDQMEALRGALGPEGLRNQVKTLASENKDLREKVTPLENEVATLKAGPAREKKLEEKLGITDLSPAAKRDLATRKFEGDEPTEDELKSFAEDYGLQGSQQPSGSTEGETTPEAGKIVNHAQGAAQGAEAASTVIKPEDAAAWGVDDRIQFRSEHPKEWEQLLRGKEVNVAFSPSS